LVVSHVEDIAAEFYRLSGYIVSRNIWYKLPKGAGRRVPGWADIDVLALSDGDMRIVACVTDAWTPSPSKDEFVGRVLQRFKDARRYCIPKYPLLKTFDQKSIHDVFVAEWINEGVWNDLEKAGVEVHETKEILVEMLKLLKRRIGEGGLKEEHPLTRTLSYMLGAKLVVLGDEG